MSYLLFLDDDRLPRNVTWVGMPAVSESAWTIVRSYDEFISCIQKIGVPQFVSFDHDLGDNAYAAAARGDEEYGGEKTGFHCAEWLVNYCHDNDKEFPIFQVHSMNPSGGKRIRDCIQDAVRHDYIRIAK
jgi:hypothetical protein